MPARHRAYLEKLSAPIVAWLIDRAYINDEVGVLEIAIGSDGYYKNLREATFVASRDCQQMKPVPIPPKLVRERLPVQKRERL